jgi:DNA-directed RNA polymerase specialized sigma24 family protein
LLAQERHIALRAAFAGLSEQCQQLLTLLFHDPPTPYATISATMGLPVGGIGPSRQRCLDKLRTSAPMAAHLDNATEGR